jgi:hypothetical protein
MEAKYEDEDLALLLLVSLPSSFMNFRDTICISRDILTLTEVYEALQQREKMKSMVQAESLSSKAEALEVRGTPEQRDNYHHHNNRDKSKTDRGRSKSKRRDKFCRYCKKSNHNIDDCWKLQNKEKRNGTYQPKNNEGNGKVSVASVTRVNSTNVLDEGLRIGADRASDELEGKISQTRCVSKVNVGCKPGLLSICPSPSSPGPYI